MLSHRKPGNMISRMLEKKRKQLLSSQANDEDGVEIIDIKLPTLRRLMSDQSKHAIKTEVIDEDTPDNQYFHTEEGELGYSDLEVKTENFQFETKFSNQNSFSCSSCPYIASSLDMLEDHLRLHSGQSSIQSNSYDISCKEPKVEESVWHSPGLTIGNHFLAEDENDMNTEKKYPNNFFRDPALKSSARNKINNDLRMDLPLPIKLEKEFHSDLNEQDIMDIAEAEEYENTAAESSDVGFLEVHANQVKFVKIERKELNLKRVNCRFCSYSTNKKFHLRRHLSSHFKLKTYQCQECSYGTYRKDYLQRHQFVHCKNKPLKCFKCKFGTDDKDTLITHIEKHFKRKLYSCDQCQFGTYGKEEYKSHLQACGALHFVCSVCDYVSSKRAELRRHMRSHLYIQNEHKLKSL